MKNNMLRRFLSLSLCAALLLCAGALLDSHKKIA